MSALKRKEHIGLTLGEAGLSMLWQFLLLTLAFFCTEVYGVEITNLGFIVISICVLGLILDLLFKRVLSRFNLFRSIKLPVAIFLVILLACDILFIFRTAETPSINTELLLFTTLLVFIFLYAYVFSLFQAISVAFENRGVSLKMLFNLRLTGTVIGVFMAHAIVVTTINLYSTSSTSTVQAEINNDILDIKNTISGTAKIAVYSEDKDGKKVYDHFNISKRKAKIASPTIHIPINDTVLESGFDESRLYIGDKLLGYNNIELNVESDNESVLKTYLKENYIYLKEMGNGNANIRLTYTINKEQENSHYFNIRIKKRGNHNPIERLSFEDLTLVEKRLDNGNWITRMFELYATTNVEMLNYFLDPDGDHLHF